MEREKSGKDSKGGKGKNPNEVCKPGHVIAGGFNRWRLHAGSHTTSPSTTLTASAASGGG